MSKTKGFIEGSSPRIVWVDHAGEEQAMPAVALQTELRAAKTNAQRQAALKARRAAVGIGRLIIWAHGDDAQRIREYAAKLAARRAKGQA